MTLGKHQEAFSKDLNKLLTYLHDNGYNVRCGELQRTKEQQELYIKQGRSKTYNSYHLKRLAIDIFIFKNDVWLNSKDDLQVIGNFWEQLNPLNKWGGNFKSFIDTPHFERRAGI